MKKLIVHIGYPKTGTTTLQNSVFAELHKEGRITYLGKEKSAADQPGRESVARLLEQALTGDRSFDPHTIQKQLSDSRVTVISNENFMPSVGMLIAHNYDPELISTYARRLKELLPDAGEVVLLVTLRSQESFVHSSYVGAYTAICNEERYSSWSRFLAEVATCTGERFPVYRYDTVLDEYARYFGKESIRVLFFEQFQRSPNEFARQLAQLLEVDDGVIAPLLDQGAHRKERWKTADAYVVGVPKGGAKKNLFLRLSRVRGIRHLHKAAKRVFGERNPVTSLYRLCVRKFGHREHRIPKPTQREREQLREQFRESNERLAREFDLDRETLAAYGYI